MTWRVLIADADPLVREGLARQCAAAGHEVRVAGDAAELERALATAPVDLALVELALHGRVACRAETRVVLVAPSELARGVEALQRGASDLLEKPCARERVEAALERARRVRAARSAPREDAPLLRGRSPAMRRLAEQIERVARTPGTTVLLRGELGVELEQVAGAIHRRSARARGPFLVCRAATAAPGQIESLLFGAREAPQAGLVAEAEGGTIFLDDVDRLPLAVQTRLLRLLRERLRRAPDGSELASDVRLIAASGGRLEAEVARGAFREDLFYRLNVLTLVVPALRERGEDLLELARELLGRRAIECGRPIQGFTPAAEAALAHHRWPGNVRELANVIERGVLFARSERLDLADLALHAAPEGAPAGEFLPLGDRSLRGVEAALIRRVLAEVGGNKRRAAQLLGISRATLYNKLQTLSAGG